MAGGRDGVPRGGVVGPGAGATTRCPDGGAHRTAAVYLFVRISIGYQCGGAGATPTTPARMGSGVGSTHDMAACYRASQAAARRLDVPRRPVYRGVLARRPRPGGRPRTDPNATPSPARSARSTAAPGSGCWLRSASPGWSRAPGPSANASANAAPGRTRAPSGRAACAARLRRPPAAGWRGRPAASPCARSARGCAAARARSRPG
jgi:hypothetical protein